MLTVLIVEHDDIADALQIADFNCWKRELMKQIRYGVNAKTSRFYSPISTWKHGWAETGNHRQRHGGHGTVTDWPRKLFGSGASFITAVELLATPRPGLSPPDALQLRVNFIHAAVGEVALECNCQR